MAIVGGPVTGGPFGATGIGSATATSAVIAGSGTVAAGGTSVIVTGSFAASYQVSVTPGWVTDYEVVSKTATQFTINFSVPAPAGGSTFDYIVSITTVPSLQALTGATQTV